MSNHIKYFFRGRNVEFADLLCRIGVPAYSVKGGVLLDLEALDAIPASELPMWVWRNYKDLHNPLKTRPCCSSEWPNNRAFNSNGQPFEVVAYFAAPRTNRILDGAAIPVSSIREGVKKAEMWVRLVRRLSAMGLTIDDVSCTVQSSATGEILYTAQV